MIGFCELLWVQTKINNTEKQANAIYLTNKIPLINGFNFKLMNFKNE